jgi:hypothetical protein
MEFGGEDRQSYATDEEGDKRIFSSCFYKG